MLTDPLQKNEHREGVISGGRVVRVNVPPETVVQARQYHDLWRRALRQARGMMHDDFGEDMWYEMRLYAEVYGVEPILEAAYWSAFRRGQPHLQYLRRERPDMLYLAKWSGFCRATVRDLLAGVELHVAARDAELIHDTQTGPYGMDGLICVCPTDEPDELELIVLR